MNWSEIFYLLVDKGKVTERIEYFQNGTDYLTLFLFPFLISVSYLIVYPWLQYLVMYLSTKPTTLRNSLQAESEHNLLLKKQELEDARAEILRKAEEELIDRAKRDEKLQDIDSDDVREKLKKEIDELRIERESLRNTTDTISKEKVKSLTSEQENIIQEITLEGGESTKRGIIRKSKYDKVKTEYLLESLEESGYLHGTYMSEYDDYVYALTTSSKKLMVDKGVAK